MANNSSRNGKNLKTNHDFSCSLDDYKNIDNFFLVWIYKLKIVSSKNFYKVYVFAVVARLHFFKQGHHLV